MDPKKLSNKELYALCVDYGRKTLEWRYKFVGLLPEVNRRELYKKGNFISIFEFAAKLAGISEEQVRIVLNIDRKFEDKPILRKLLVNGEVSVNKLAKITAMANKENEEFLADQVRLLNTRSLETLARDEKSLRESVHVNTNPLENGVIVNRRSETEPSLKENNQELNLTPEVKQKLLDLQNKGIDVNRMILEFLQKREQEIAQEKEKLAAGEQKKLEHLQEIWKDENVKTSRYIPAKIKNIIEKEHGQKCSVPTCKKPATEIHHSNRFSLSKIHDPRYMSPFCHEHHQIAHSVDQKYHEKRKILDLNLGR